jgi:TM2 domain-containing membrane protein YozV
MQQHPGVAAVLSFVIPGLGQVYNGHFIRAAFWLLIAFWWMDNPAAWPFEAGFWHWVVHFVPAFTAWQKAQQARLLAQLFRTPVTPADVVPPGSRTFDQ